MLCLRANVLVLDLKMRPRVEARPSVGLCRHAMSVIQTSTGRDEAGKVILTVESVSLSLAGRFTPLLLQLSICLIL